MRTFRTLSGFADHLAQVAARIPEAEHSGLERAAEDIEETAKSYIGEEQDEAEGTFPAWAPLSDATLEGFFHPNAGWIPGKTELGYAPPDNPLLRTGELRDSIEHTVEGNEAAVGSDSDVAVWQEFGTPGAMYPIPPRSFLGRAAFARSEAAVNHIVERVAWVVAGRPPRNR